MASTCPTCGNRFDSAVFCPSDGARLVGESVADDRIGQVIGARYRILRLVGEGAMGHVFEAEHIYISKRVALKLLRPQMASDAEAVQRLHREARATSEIGHENIVQIEDFGTTEDGSVFLAMEWLDGETTEAIMERGELGPDLALRIAADTCAGLAAAHKSGVVHRDLKPANIFWARKGARSRAKILDFGIAKLTSGDPQLTRTGTFVGTPYYMAPEQALGTDVDGRADIYSLGVILYEMFTGSVPFAADTSLGVLHQHTSRPPEPPRRRAPRRSISAAVEAVILRCMAKAPADRYATAAELGAALEAARIDADAIEPAPPRHEVRTPAPSVPPRPVEHVELDDDDDGWEVPRRRPPVLLIGVLVALAVGAGVGAFLLVRGSGDAGGQNAAGAPIDAGARVASATGDAASAPGPGPGTPMSVDAAPASPAWTHHVTGDGYAYDVTVRPRPIAVGEEVTMSFAIEPSDERMRAAMADHSLVATVEYRHYLTHRKVDEAATGVSDDGRLILTEVFDKKGKHHVSLRLASPEGRFPTTTFDLCVGEDPDAPAAVLKRVCPGLNAPPPAAGKSHHSH